MASANRQRCSIAHKTWTTLARCIRPYAEVASEGPYAVIYAPRQYSKMLVLLFPTREQADEELRVGHGGRTFRELFPHPHPGEVA